jgi:hypothetical protein
LVPPQGRIAQGSLSEVPGDFAQFAGWPDEETGIAAGCGATVGVLGVLCATPGRDGTGVSA